MNERMCVVGGGAISFLVFSISRIKSLLKHFHIVFKVKQIFCANYLIPMQGDQDADNK